MGLSSSKLRVVSDPVEFASKLEAADSRDTSSWRAYDYVIVGTAGCVLASRLSEDPNITVLLIEAGKSNKGNLLLRIPLAFTELFTSAVNWQYKTTVQAELNNKRLGCDRGKVLGGSSSINASVYQRCSPLNFAAWVEAGAEGWGAAEMEHYFNKAEKHTPNAEVGNAALHGTSGLSETRCGPFAPISGPFINAEEAVGVPRISDMNGPDGPAGVSYFAGSVDPHGERSSAATAYLKDSVLARPNLTVAVESMVAKVIFDKEEGSGFPGPRAVGVLLQQTVDGPVFGVAAKREVILSAGAIATPQLLMLSGIGPASELEKHDIEIVQDLPFVGRNLLDHYSAGSLVVRTKAGMTWDHILSPLGGLVALSRWLISGSGPMAGTAAPVGLFVHSQAILDSPTTDHKAIDMSASPKDQPPNIEIFLAPLIVVNNGSTKTPGKHGFTIGCVAIDPASKGRITLASKNVFDHPVIDPRYLSDADAQDLRVLVKATRLALRIVRAAPLAGIVELPEHDDDKTTYFWPGDADPDTVTDEALEAWIRRNGQTCWHPTSTAKMGASSKTSVVDARLRVHGISNLRVVDASVFPTSVAGHPCAVVVAVAEKAADIVKAAQKGC
ncbi:GMC oxidoreductase [Mycena chlorophos]|uniref:GMC oxidoreductase n=1 Tax=Mycena chlorophos TaxID=658473 RepID=A0A8H6S1E6_MYCCL|nr:GMC oxidoreductase [Mycena chlorophos]